MKNELGFIPDNISAISNASLYMQPTTQHDPNDNQDSTDHLVEEILRQRAERLQRQEEKAELGSLDETNKKLLLEIRDSKEEMASGSSEFRLKDSLKTSREKLSRHDLIIPEINESIAEKQEMSQVSPDNHSQVSSHPHLQPTPSKSPQHHADSIHQAELQVEDRIETLNNHTKGESEHEANESDRDAQEEEAIRSINSKESSLISKPQSLQRSSGKKEEEQNNSMDAPQQERIPKLNLSISPSEKKSQRSLQIHNLIEERINEENSDHRSPSNPAQSHQSNESHHSHPSQQSQSHSHHNHSHPSQSHREQMARQLQALESHIEVKHSMIESETPINLFTDKKGFYDFTPKVGLQPDEQNLAIAITQQLNSPRDLPPPPPEPPRQPARPARQSGHSAAAKSSEGDFTTDYSECPRELLILEHRYESNVQVLFVQTRELLQLYHSMLLDEQKKQTRKALMILEIENRREKISLRNASYTKRYNFISPIGRNNDKPIEFVPKFRVKQQLINRQEELAEQIHHQKHLATVQEQKLQLLTRYYDHVKGTTIPHGPDPLEHYAFDSTLGRFTRPGQPTPPLPASILASHASPRTHRTPLKSPNSLKSPTALKSATSLKSPSKTRVSAAEQIAGRLQAATPESYFNLLHYKRQIGKQMVAQFEVFTLGKLKRLKDQNRLLKKELQFVEQHVQNFDRQFAEELKQYEIMGKPKVTYESFQVVENKTPFTKSPLSRQYHANNRGSNNINVYRPDNSPPPRALSKSLSQSKYTIQRPPLPNPKLVSPNTSNQQISQKGKRIALNSPNRDYEMPQQHRFRDVELSEIAEAGIKGRPPKRPLNRSNSASKKSLSGMKNLVKNRESVQTEQCLPTPSQLPQVTSEYYISFDRNQPY